MGCGEDRSSKKKKCVLEGCNGEATISSFCYKHWMLFDAGEIWFSRKKKKWVIPNRRIKCIPKEIVKELLD